MYELETEEMIAKWLEFCNQWIDAEAHDAEDWQRLDRSYITNHDALGFYHGEHFFLSVHVDLDDELREANLLGVFDADPDPSLEYLTAEVDTDWRDVWARSGGFLNKP